MNWVYYLLQKTRPGFMLAAHLHAGSKSNALAVPTLKQEKVLLCEKAEKGSDSNPHVAAEYLWENSHHP